MRIKMIKGKLKTFVIVLIGVFFAVYAIDRNQTLKGIEKENTALELKISLMKYTKEIADSLMFDTTQHALDLAARLATYEKKIKEYESNKYKVTVTMYHPVFGQTDDTPNITADGTVIKISRASEYRYIAVSRNMLVDYGGFLRFGDYVWVDASKKSGLYQVKDTMNKRFMNRIDILETPGTAPYKYNDASITIMGNFNDL